MSDIRIHHLPPVPTTTAFPELNVRTYVRANGVPAVWFMTLDASSRLAVAVARRWYRLHYHLAAMRCRVTRGGVEFSSHRGGGGAEFEATYGPLGKAYFPEFASLDHFLVERYRLYAGGDDGLLCADVEHAPWRLYRARAEIRTNTMVQSLGLRLGGVTPHLRYARRMEVLAGRPQRVRGSQK